MTRSVYKPRFMAIPASNPASDTLFLHWGPGAHARVERELLGDLPVQWWDQPSPIAESGNAFEALVSSAEAELKKLSHARGKPIRLLAHSFGGEIAYRLSLRVPELIRQITLLGSSHFVPRAFLNLARRLQSLSDALPSAVLAADKRLEEDTFWPLIQGIASIPDFSLHYWGKNSDAARDAFLSVARKHPGLDLPIFQAVLSAYFAHVRANSDRPSPFRGEVALLLGDQDPLSNIPAETQGWKKRFPELRATTLPCGHFVHFEQPASKWLA